MPKGFFIFITQEHFTVRVVGVKTDHTTRIFTALNSGEALLWSAMGRCGKLGGAQTDTHHCCEVTPPPKKKCDSEETVAGTVFGGDGTSRPT